MDAHDVAWDRCRETCRHVLRMSKQWSALLAHCTALNTAHSTALAFRATLLHLQVDVHRGDGVEWHLLLLAAAQTKWCLSAQPIQGVCAALQQLTVQ